MPSASPAAADAAPGVERVIFVRTQSSALWVIAALLAVVATCLMFGGTSLLSGDAAMAQSGMMGARGLFAFTGQLDRTQYGLWMMDVDAGTVWCYAYNPAKDRMRLVAARSFRYDRYLENLNQSEPTPDQVQQLLGQQRQAQTRAQNLGAAPQPPPTPPSPAGMTGAQGAAGS